MNPTRWCRISPTYCLQAKQLSLSTLLRTKVIKKGPHQEICNFSVFFWTGNLDSRNTVDPHPHSILRDTPLNLRALFYFRENIFSQYLYLKSDSAQQLTLCLSLCVIISHTRAVMTALLCSVGPVNAVSCGREILMSWVSTFAEILK